VRRAGNLNTFMCRLSWNLWASALWNPQGLSTPVMGLLYLYLYPFCIVRRLNEWVWNSDIIKQRKKGVVEGNPEHSVTVSTARTTPTGPESNLDLRSKIWYDTFNCNLVATRWQQFSTHIHTNNTENVTKQTIQRTQKYIEQHKNT